MGKRSRSKRETGSTPETPASSAAIPHAALSTQHSALAWLLSAAIAVVTIAVYAQVRSHQFINFDDPDYVVRNSHVNSGLTWANVVWAFTTVHAANWHPITWISHMLDVQLFGLDAGKALLVNVAFHIANTILLLFFLRRATGDIWRSAVVAALFALHPLHVESVAWLSERKDVLSTFFAFLAITFYLRDRKWLTLLFFALGVMAKPMVITLPFVLLLLDWWPLNRWSLRDPKPLVRLSIEKWPMFLIIPLSALATTRAQRVAMAPVGLLARVANAGIAYVRYLGKALVPEGLTILYPFPTRISPVIALLCFALLVAITIVVVRFAERFPYLPVGWFWFAGTLVPAIGIVQVGQQAMADRYTYVPLIGIFIAVVWLAADTIRQPRLLGAVAVVIVAVLSFATFKQVATWHDSFSVFSRAVRLEPKGRTSHVNLGASYLKQLDYDAAADQYRQALALYDRDEIAWDGLGLALGGLGDVDGARRNFETAMRIKPDAPEPYRGLGRIELAGGHPERAIPLLRKADAIEPDDATTAALASAENRVPEAIEAYRRALAHDPDAELHNDLGALLSRSGDDHGALEQYDEALRIAPGSYDAQMNAGALLARMGRSDDALTHFRAAAALRPKSSEPHVYLALLYGNANRFAEAAGEVRAAAAIDPVAANAQFSNAVHIEPKPTNLSEYLGALERKAAGRG